MSMTDAWQDAYYEWSAYIDYFVLNMVQYVVKDKQQML